MKNKIYKVLLTMLIIVHIAAPFLELAVWGYDIPEMLSDIYSNGVIVILSAAILHVLKHNDKNE